MSLQSVRCLTASERAFQILGGEAFFSDKVPFDADTDVWVEATMGKWILESEALEALRNVKDASRLKHRITAVTDRRRLKGRWGVQDYPLVLGGTINERRVLRDLTGARRFWIWQGWKSIRRGWKGTATSCGRK